VGKSEDDALREELEGVWTEVRTAFAEFRLADAKRYLDVPEGSPEPTREQAAQLAEFLPDVRAGRLLHFERQGDVAALWRVPADLGPGETGVVVFRFRRAGDRWKVYPAPYSSSSYSTDDPGVTREQLMERPEFRLVPGPEDEGE
jgi:hypothetical protein